VDDEPYVRDILGRILRRDAYRVHEASGADAAIQILEATCIGVMLVDRNMPGRDGDWLVTQARERFAHTAIILATGEYVPPHIANQRGIAGYLSKPFTVEAVRSAVGDAAMWHQVATNSAKESYGG
jgi:DNA-binding NtrC family response regulator